MRAGAGAAQPTLSPESASVLKHSLALARRRGHAQVTPLHVAATLLLTSSFSSAGAATSLLRAACLKSRPPPSHPLQCRALELCFNVALNRLPAAPTTLHHRHNQLPALSNALIAALKRAQAHQRRGFIEQQQHQQAVIVAIRVELEQLILSILDDPSVSRVMKEAGFSSTLIKTTFENSNPNSSIPSVFKLYSPSNAFYPTPSHPPTYTNFTNPNPQNYQNPNFNEEIKLILGVLLGNKRRNTVILGDSTSMAEFLIADLMSVINTDNVPDALKSAKLIKFQVSSLPLQFMNKQEVDTNMNDLKKKVESCASSTGKVIIYIGDLQWAVDNRHSSAGLPDDKESSVHHLIAGIGKLLRWCNNSGNIRVWLMAAASYQTYMKCKMRMPLLDSLWDLQAVSGALGLSLNASSGLDSRITSSQNTSQALDKKLLFPMEEEKHGSVQLPVWLKPLDTDHHHHYKDDFLVQLRRKDHNLCQIPHQGSQNWLRNDSLCWPCKNSNISDDPKTSVFACTNQMASSFPPFKRRHSSTLDSFRSMEDHKEVKIALALGTSGKIKDRENLGNVLKESVPWQVETIPLIVEALTEMDGCDQGTNDDYKVMLIQGNDVVGKRRAAAGIAKALFGSSDLLFCLNMRNSANSAFDNCEMLEKALNSLEKIVVLVEDIECADPEFVKFLSGILEISKSCSWRWQKARCAIFVLTMDSETIFFNDNARSELQMKLEVHESEHGSKMRCPDLKRRADWDSPMMPTSKAIRRSNETEEVSSNERKEHLIRSLSSSSSLDLNVRADENENEALEEPKPGGDQVSPISSDLTRDTSLTEQHGFRVAKFLNRIKTCFIFNTSSDEQDRAGEANGGVKIPEEYLSGDRRRIHMKVGRLV